MRISPLKRSTVTHRARHRAVPTPRRRPRWLRAEPLEHRYLLAADLGLGDSGGSFGIAEESDLSVRFRLETTDLGGNPITSIEVGSSFLLRTFVQDVRAETETPGIFSAYLDVQYDALLAAPNGNFVFAPEFPTVQLGSVATAGLIDDAGALSAGATNTQSEYFLFSLPFQATAGGMISFEGFPATNLREVLVFGPNQPVPTEQIDYGLTTLEVIAPPAISVAETSVLEGDDGSKTLEFLLTLSKADPDAAISVNFATVAGTATGGVDFIAANGTATFAPGTTQQVVSVQVVSDRIFEPDETLSLVLSNPVNATLDVDTAIGTILNDDSQPTISIANRSINEGNVGNAAAQFTVSLSNPSSETVSVQFITVAGTASAGVDYVSNGGTISFAPGAVEQTITVQITGDLTHEANETFDIVLSSPTAATIAQDTAEVTILDDDGPPAISIASASVVEGDAGSNNISFNVTLSHPSDFTITVNFATQALTATAGIDFQTTTGTLTFQPGQTLQTILVPVLGDTLSEANETFRVTLSNPTAATIAVSQNVGTINDNDPLPTLDIAPASVAEGNTGTALLAFVVQLSAVSGQTVTVGYATAVGTATAGTDYQAATGTLTFAPGDIQKTIFVTVLGDQIFESNETLFVNLSSPSGALLDTSQATGTILDDDSAPVISIADASRAEGNAGTSSLQFTVTLTNPSSQVITVNFATTPDTATADVDYQATSGILTFNPGETQKTIDVPIVGDTLHELDEQFTVTLSAPDNASLDDDQAIGTITNDDPQPTISVFDTQVVEGNTGTTSMVFTVSLSAPSALPVTVDYATAAGTATADTDFQSTAGTLTFPAETTSLTITVPILGDTSPEPNETVLLNLSNPSGATIDRAQASGSITDDDQPPTLSINSISTDEGDSGTRAMQFTVTLSRASDLPVTVSLATSAGTATSGVDFEPLTGQLTFQPGDLQKTITVQIIGDSLDEADETLFVTLSSPTNATLANAIGTGTILDNDPLPALAISDAIFNEGDSGFTLAEFPVQLSAVSGRPVTVFFSTADDSATLADNDYLAISGTITFQPGETQKTITVSVIGDTEFESVESFFVNLSSPVNATLQRAQARSVIFNDDDAFTAASISGFVYVDANNDGAFQSNEKPLAGVAVHLNGTDDFGAVFNSTVFTSDDGSYSFTNLNPGNYVVTQTQPAFFLDGIDTAGPGGQKFDPTRDRFDVRVESGVQTTAHNFGERGLRPEFISKRLFLASRPTDGYYTALSLAGGPVWIAFDAGYSGLLNAHAVVTSGGASVAVTLYDSNLQPLVGSGVGNGQAKIDWLGQSGEVYFLQISGVNSVVNLQLTQPDPQLFANSFSALSAAGPIGWEAPSSVETSQVTGSQQEFAQPNSTVPAPSSPPTNNAAAFAHTSASLLSDTIDQLFATLSGDHPHTAALEPARGIVQERTAEAPGWLKRVSSNDALWRAWSAHRSHRTTDTSDDSDPFQQTLDQAWASFRPHRAHR